MKTQHLLALAALSGLLLGSPASAEIKWQTNSSAGCTGTSYGNSCDFSASSVTVTANAWANTVSTSNTQIETAYLGVYGGGLGVTNRDASSGDSGEGTTPEHAMDNNDRFDSILFSFSSKIVLSKVDIGYKSGDSDISVLAYIGSGAPVMGGKTYADLQASSDWVKVGNYADLSTSASKTVNTGNTSSSFWLIGAYNSTFGGTLDTGNDHVKLLALYGNKPTLPSQVPTPPTLLLMGAGMLGLLRLRKR